MFQRRTTRRQRKDQGFTLIELLVVIAIIALLASMLLPALSKAKGKAQQIYCLNSLKNLSQATHLYTGDHQEWFPPIQIRIGAIETSWRYHLFGYVAQTPAIYDCPTEKVEIYAKAKLSTAPNGPARPALLGKAVADEISIPSGIGAVNVHYISPEATPPFGRPIGYEDNICRWPDVQIPSKLLLFGDGHSDIYGVWPNDRWWIWKELGDSATVGFNRLAQGDKGAIRHGGKSNYTYADGSATLLNAAKIPCNTTECHWSAKADPH